MTSGCLLLIFDPRRSRHRAVRRSLNRKRSVQRWPGKTVAVSGKDRLMDTDLLREVAATDSVLLQVFVERCHGRTLHNVQYRVNANLAHRAIA